MTTPKSFDACGGCISESEGDLLPRSSNDSTMSPGSARPTMSPVISPRSSDEWAGENLQADAIFDFDEMLPAPRVPIDVIVLENPLPRSPPRKVRRFVPSANGVLPKVRETVTTPRGKDMGYISGPESPRTPKTTTNPGSVFSPPAFVPKSKNLRPPLLRALLTKSIDEVKAALQQNPMDAKEPFWDHDCEPPLCAAVRLECSASIVKLLLEYGADPEAKDARGRDPSQMFKEPPSWEVNPLTTCYYAPMWVPTMELLPSTDSYPPFEHQLSEHFKECEAWRQEVSDLFAGLQ